MQQNTVQITQVTAENFGTLLILIADVPEYEHLPPADQEARTSLRRDYQPAQPRYHAYIATINGKPEGYFTYYFTYSTFLACQPFWKTSLQEDYRKQG